MKILLGISLLAAALFSAATNADAKEKLRKNETWCLDMSIGGSDGGGTIMQCLYETRDQCMQARANGDTCMLNPRIPR